MATGVSELDMANVTISLVVLGAAWLAAASESPQKALPPRPPIPRNFEPPQPSAVKISLLAACQEKSLSLTLKSPGPERVADFRFGAQKISSADLRNLNSWLSRLRGSIGAKVLCDRNGARVMFEEQFDFDRAARRWVEVSYFQNKLSLVNAK